VAALRLREGDDRRRLVEQTASRIRGWDRDSTAPMCTFPRFDLGETAYALPVYADVTPAWREIYTRIADELVGRHTTYWAAVDWLTLIGHIRMRSLSSEWLVFLPVTCAGRYDPPGWTANGRRALGLSPTLGADGNLSSVVSSTCCCRCTPTSRRPQVGSVPSR